jgi:hypothetical protein
MNQRLIVDSQSELREFRETGLRPENQAIRVPAQVLSYIFHPLFVPIYIIVFLLAAEPYFFASFTVPEKFIILLRFFIIYCFFPLVTVLLLKGLGFVNSIFLRTQKERIIPIIVCNIYYFWMAYVLRHQPEFSSLIGQLAIAIFISSSIALLANIYMKVSMHSISMGILVGFVALLAFTQGNAYTMYLSLSLLVAGLVCTARFIVSDHTQREIYGGFLIGLVSILLAFWANGILP